MSLQAIEVTPSAYAYPLLIKQLLHSAVATAGDQEIVYRDHSRFTYRQFFQRLGIHVTAWLVFAALDQVQRQVLQLALVGLHRLFFKRCDGRTTQQCIQSTSETSFLDGHGDSLSWLGSGDT